MARNFGLLVFWFCGVPWLAAAVATADPVGPPAWSSRPLVDSPELVALNANAVVRVTDVTTKGISGGGKWLRVRARVLEVLKGPPGPETVEFIAYAGSGPL